MNEATWLPIMARLVDEASSRTARNYTVPQAAELLCLPEERLREAIASGHLPICRIGRPSNYRLLPVDLVAFFGAAIRPDPEIERLRDELEAVRAPIREAAAARSLTRVPRATKRVVVARDGRRCRYCGRNLHRREPLHLDHVVPRSKGGTHDTDNLVVACVSCNTRKNRFDLDQCGLVLLPAPESVNEKVNEPVST